MRHATSPGVGDGSSSVRVHFARRLDLRRERGKKKERERFSEVMNQLEKKVVTSDGKQPNKRNKIKQKATTRCAEATGL